MSTFGQAQEAGEGFVNRLYTGVENFNVVFVCPTHAELKTIYGERAKEPNYLSTDDDGNRQCRIDIFLNNNPAEGENEIATKVSFYVTESEKLSQTNKRLYMNAYGQTAWLPLDGGIPDNMKWYDVTGSRAAFGGVSDFTAMFSGNFASIKAATKSPNKIGLLLGVKTTDDGKMYQDAYTRNTLRQWAKESGNFDYLRASVTEAQQNGAFSKTVFGSPDYKLREFTAGEAPTDEGLFNQTDPGASAKEAISSSFFGGNDEQHDDVPF